MPKAISPKDRVVLLVGITIVMSILISARGVPAIASWQATERTNAASLVQREDHARKNVRALRQTLDTLSAKRSRLAQLRAGLLKGDSPTLAGAWLAEHISDLAADNDVELGAVQIKSDSTKGAFVPVQLRASVSGDLESVVDFLSTIETGLPVIAVRELTISQPAVALTAAQPELLRVEVVIEGLADARQGLSAASRR